MANGKGQNLTDKIEATLFNLLDYCSENNWAGYDPYDALNSKIFQLLPFLNSRIPRLVLTQILKRLPINFRPILLVSKEQNPKAIALFLMALVKMKKLGILDRENLIEQMVERLEALRSPNTNYWCWGYSFPWQTRTILVPRSAPNLVCTAFVANALMDAYEMNHESRCLTMAASAADYILNELYWTKNESITGFSYPLPSLQTLVHNANFLGAAVLCRVYNLTGEKKYLEPALKPMRQYSAS